jgi:hypothetical protein
MPLSRCRPTPADLDRRIAQTAPVIETATRHGRQRTCAQGTADGGRTRNARDLICASCVAAIFGATDPAAGAA